MYTSENCIIMGSFNTEHRYWKINATKKGLYSPEFGLTHSLISYITNIRG